MLLFLVCSHYKGIKNKPILTIKIIYSSIHKEIGEIDTL